MRVFVAGATGAIGRTLVPLLLESGHEVTGMTRSPERAAALRERGAQAAVADALDAGAVREAVAQASPEVIVDELTDIPPSINPKRYEQQMAGNDRLRVEGTRNLVAAADGARIIAQSIAFAYRPMRGGLWTEDDDLYHDAPGPFQRSVKAVASLEQQVTAAEGIVLRYGYFYGPGTAYAAEGPTADMVRRRRLPVIGGGSGTWSFIQVEDAARATLAAIEPGVDPGIYNVVDDDPAPVHEWLPAYARALGAPTPRRVPTWLARLVAGEFAVQVMTRSQGASNAKAKRGLAWQPSPPSWREGFRTAL